MPKVGKNQNETRLFLGIDPGKSGGMAVVTSTRRLLTFFSLAKATERDIWEFVSSDTYSFSTIEKVGGFTGTPQPGSRMFNFGQGYGALRMSLIAAGVPFDEVRPQKWLKEFGLIRAKTDTDTIWKNRLRQKAEQLFPGVKITLAVSDAVLLAEYARRFYGAD